MIGRRKKDLPKWRYDFNCRKCDNVQFINDPEHGRKHAGGHRTRKGGNRP